METDVRRMNNNWIELEKKAQNRMGWRMLVGGLCSIGNNRRKFTSMKNTIYEFDKKNSSVLLVPVKALL
ncbi:unnamed protein product [Schistosoma margrebowiei]|uniref:Uncharacterized protein n=1 Tax=Schistosoma margrebowiei TaxID=48269 RepID=A0A183M1G9_9TREM|nr:unnamed protein product [Schistosoma margrebowiei]